MEGFHPDCGQSTLALIEQAVAGHKQTISITTD